MAQRYHTTIRLIRIAVRAAQEVEEPELDPEPEIWVCEACGKEFDKKTFSHDRMIDDGHGNPRPMECGPIKRR
jgi:hypothetical protein